MPRLNKKKKKKKKIQKKIRTGKLSELSRELLREWATRHIRNQPMKKSKLRP
jgi:hypothetical protein